MSQMVAGAKCNFVWAKLADVDQVLGLWAALAALQVSTPNPVRFN